MNNPLNPLEKRHHQTLTDLPFVRFEAAIFKIDPDRSSVHERPWNHANNDITKNKNSLIMPYSSLVRSKTNRVLRIILSLWAVEREYPTTKPV